MLFKMLYHLRVDSSYLYSIYYLLPSSNFLRNEHKSIKYNKSMSTHTAVNTVKKINEKIKIFRPLISKRNIRALSQTIEMHMS